MAIDNYDDDMNSSDPLILFLQALADAPPDPCMDCPRYYYCAEHHTACDDYRVYIEYGVAINSDRHPSRAIFQKSELL